MIPKEINFLVVDDIAAMRNITASLLRGLKMGQVFLASNGKEALQMLERQRIDMILSDWKMPVMSGLELLKEIRQNGSTAQMPFIMITAEADRGRISEVIAAGVSDLLIKPYTSGQLVSRIERSLSHQRMAPKASPAAAPRPATEGVPQLPTVLLVDDTPANLQLLHELLKGEFRVRTASNGQKALDICQSDTPPDLVLLDVMMPDMDGFEVAQRLRQHPNSETIPVIFVTAKTDQESHLKGLELGAVDFVAKPVDPDVLLPRVRNFMRYVALHKQLQANCDAMMDAARLHDDVEQITRHDLRGPLAGIITLARTLATNRSLGAHEVEQVELIAESALQVMDMINLSSELFKIETGRFVLQAQPVNLGDLLGRMVKTVATSYASQEIDLALEMPDDGEAVALGDPAFYYSIFQNLIKNACEASPPHTRVTVAITCGERVQVEISNSGAVPAAMRDCFFDKFRTCGKEAGSGLGTYSAKLLTEAQGGQIAMSASDEENSTVIKVTVPRANA
jgi:two-component system, sensor histidine kinase and response regulator